MVREDSIGLGDLTICTRHRPWIIFDAFVYRVYQWFRADDYLRVVCVCDLYILELQTGEFTGRRRRRR